MAVLQKRQHDISHICVPFLQCKPGVVFSSSYLPSWFLCKIINWNSESFKQQNLVSKIFWMQGLQVTRLSSLGTFLFISRCSLGYQGSLWTYLQVVACFQTQGEHWREKKSKFHTSGSFSCFYKQVSSIAWLKSGAHMVWAQAAWSPSLEAVSIKRL